MYASRHAYLQHAAQLHTRNLHVTDAQVESSLLTLQKPYDAQCTHAVGNAGGYGHAFHSHVEADDKHQVEHRVDHARQYQYVEGAACVAAAPQNGGTEVEYQEKGNA